MKVNDIYILSFYNDDFETMLYKRRLVLTEIDGDEMHFKNIENIFENTFWKESIGTRYTVDIDFFNGPYTKNKYKIEYFGNADQYPEYLI